MEYNLPSEFVKDVNFGEEAKIQIIAGVEKLAKAVKSTLGASGKFFRHRWDPPDNETHLGVSES